MFEPHITRDALIKMKTEIQYKRGVCRIEDIFSKNPPIHIILKMICSLYKNHASGGRVYTVHTVHTVQYIGTAVYQYVGSTKQI